jgi:hypothetical protein
VPPFPAPLCDPPAPPAALPPLDVLFPALPPLLGLPEFEEPQPNAQTTTLTVHTRIDGSFIGAEMIRNPARLSSLARQ